MIENQLPLPEGVKKAKTYVDVGAGIRPCRWFPGAECIVIEPSPVYANKLRAAGFVVIEQRAIDALPDIHKHDAIVMLDVIEHMEKDEGLKCIELAKEKCDQLVIFTPWGFMEQNTDNWGLDQHDLQTHRSGWKPDDLPGFQWKRHHRGFFAIHTR